MAFTRLAPAHKGERVYLSLVGTILLCSIGIASLGRARLDNDADRRLTDKGGNPDARTNSRTI